MEVAIKLLMAGGAFNIGYAFLIPLVMFALRRQTFTFARYGRSVALFNGAILLRMIFLVQFSCFNLAIEPLGAALRELLPDHPGPAAGLCRGAELCYRRGARPV